MFNAKRIDTGEVFQVLDVIYDDVLHQTHFLIWQNGKWRWRDANKFVPPNVEIKVENIKK